MYVDGLIDEGVLTKDDVSRMISTYTDYLNEQFNEAATYKPEASYLRDQWSGIEQASNNVTYWDTGVNFDILRYIGEKSVSYPEGFVSLKI